MMIRMLQVALISLSCVGVAVASPPGKARGPAAKPDGAIGPGRGAGIQGGHRSSGPKGATRKRKLLSTGGKLDTSRRAFAVREPGGDSLSDTAATFLRDNGTFDGAKLESLGKLHQSYMRPFSQLEDLTLAHILLNARIRSQISTTPATEPKIAALRSKIATFRTLASATTPARDEAWAYLRDSKENRPAADDRLISLVSDAAYSIAELTVSPEARTRLVAGLDEVGTASLRKGLELYAGMAAKSAGAIADVRVRHAATLGPAEALYQEINDEISALAAAGKQ